MQMMVERGPAIRAGDVDWRAHWEALVAAREAMNPSQVAGGSRWDNRADRFARLTQNLDAANDPFVRAILDAVHPDDAVLDVGAGAGRYGLPIASHVARITAVEPSAGMRAQLAEGAGARGVANLTIVASSWQEATVEPHNVAFVANVLYFVRDAAAFLDKLDRSARRACFILHRLEENGAALGPLWAEIHGKARPPEPNALELLNLLFSMGIRAQLRPAPRPAPARYASLDEAVDDARQRLDIAEDDHAHDARIRSFVASLVAERDGGLVGQPGSQMAIISWEH
ncbi:MAG: hypothetical protein QOF51_1908 [Chloroflexota bacterium]|jgi:SAM-dependent methyltransferase|nr:hypothetical protein [Chloroflexota bacterium]